jgi:predicted amidophosphoribosyltransferase
MKKVIKTDDDLKEIAKKILALKGKNNDFCPSCGNLTEYHSNPFYYHICETCGKKMSMSDLIYKSDIEYVVDVLKQEFYENISLVK